MFGDLGFIFLLSYFGLIDNELNFFQVESVLPVTVIAE